MLEFDRHDWGVDEDFVKRIVKAYLKGEASVVINGSKYSVARQILIYENQSAEGVGGVLVDALNKSEGAKSNFDKKFFDRKFKNATDRFLLSRNWAELKDNYYNIYINDGKEKPVILVVNKIEIDKFLKDWSQGNNVIWVGARRIDLDNPKSVKIFDVDFEWLSKDRGIIRSNIKKYVDLVHKGSYKIEALEHFGKEVTDEFDIKPFDSYKSKAFNFNWDLIHPEITKVAKGRFVSPHYADAVEAAFKEINDIVKKEYKKITGNEEDGTPLMRKAFAHTNPAIKLTDLSTDSLRNIQEGYMNIFAGCIIGIRNPKAHSNIQIDEQDAWEKIVLASHLMKMWDNRIK